MKVLELVEVILGVGKKLGNTRKLMAVRIAAEAAHVDGDI